MYFVCFTGTPHNAKASTRMANVLKFRLVMVGHENARIARNAVETATSINHSSKISPATGKVKLAHRKTIFELYHQYEEALLFFSVF